MLEAGASRNRATASGTPASRLPSFAGCLILLAAVRILLLIIGVGRTVKFLAVVIAREQSHQRGPAPGEIARRVAKAAAVFPGRALCLEQSLVLWTLLRRRGVAVSLRLGIQPFPFAAHAWVEHAGEPLLEDPAVLEAYLPMPLPEEWTR